LSTAAFVFFFETKNIRTDAKEGYESITQTDLKKHLTVLSSDSLEGRETSFPGQKKAAEYIANEFKALGLKPAGDNGTYLQHFDVELTNVSAETRLVLQSRTGMKTYSWAKDFISADAQDTSVTGPVAFVGFMDSQLDEENKAKLAGKVIVTFAGMRQFADDTSSEQFGRRLFAFRQERDLLAVVVITDNAGAFSFDKVLPRVKERALTRDRMTLKGFGPTRVRLPLTFYVSPVFARDILKHQNLGMLQLREKAVKDSVFSPIFLDNVTLTAQAKATRQVKQSENVLGLLEGSDPKLKDEALVFTAHYDHLGVGTDGTIFYGADDDASGTSTVLEIAEAFVKNTSKPRRSILFMTVAGEEKGLLGSRYYVTHPVIPLDKTIANINTDMIGRTDKKHDDLGERNYTYVIGSDKISTELDSVLKAANAESENLSLDYTFNDERDPNQFYRRSDHFNFARNGIPVVFFFTGVHADYHRPTDTADKIMFDKMERIARLIFYTGWKVADFDRLFAKNVALSGYYR
ncbi:MAG: M28 family peptidase, partial [Ignavibacteriales bacterium]|nr:M28 family peptidase [Ignavibacteriales bacterium]